MGALTGRPCKVCGHPRRAEIDAAIISDQSFRIIGESFAISQFAVRRHAAQHVTTEAMRAAARAVVIEEAARGRNIADQVIELQATAMRILATAEAAGDLRTALAGVREAARCIELVAKVVGELDDGTTINVTMAPAFINVQGAILAALVPFPDARLAVVRALDGLAPPIADVRQIGG